MDGLIADVNYAHFSSYKLPAVYGESFVAALGGLISYGPENIDQFRHAADYVDRILKGEKPAICRCRRRPSINW